MPQKISSHIYRDMVFCIGIIATISYRSIIILNNYNPLYVKIAWYIGTIGFIWYFAHRYRVEKDRESEIINKKLISKIQNKIKLTDQDYSSLNYVIKGVGTSKARWNYVAIFVFSIAALIYGIIHDFILIS